MKKSHFVLSIILFVASLQADIILLPGFPYGNSSDGPNSVYGIQNVLTVNGITDATQVDVSTWSAMSGQFWLVEEDAAWSHLNSFGYYDVQAPDITHEIIPPWIVDGYGGNPKPTTNPPLGEPGFSTSFGQSISEIGFYIAPQGNVAGRYCTEKNRNPASFPQIAVFQDKNDPTSWLLACEDMNAGSDHDFNDLVVKMRLFDTQNTGTELGNWTDPNAGNGGGTVSVPEPKENFMILISMLGIIGLCFARRKGHHLVSVR
jgi:hypothetical protein